MWSYHIVPILCSCQPSCGCPNKLSKTGWTQATEIHFLTFLEVRSSKSLSLGQNQGVPQRPHPLETSEDNLFLIPFSFWWLLASLGWSSITPISASGITGLSLFHLCKISLCLFRIKTLVTTFRAHPDNPWSCPHLRILKLITSLRSLP